MNKPTWLNFEEGNQETTTQTAPITGLTPPGRPSSWGNLQTSAAADPSPTYEVQKHTFYDNTVEIFFDPRAHQYYRFDGDTRVNIAGVTTVLGTAINKPFLAAWAAKLAIEYLRKELLNPDGSFKEMSTEEFYAHLETAKKRHKDELNKAGDIGSVAHNAIEVVIIDAIEHNNGVCRKEPKAVPDQWHPLSPEDLQRAQNCANRAMEWMRSHNVRWLHTERKIYSREYDYSGTLDGDAIIDSCNDRFCKGCRGRVFKDRRAITDWKSSNHLADSYAYQTAAYQFAHIEEFPDLYIPDRWIMRLGKDGEDDFEAWYLPDEYFEADFNAFLAALNLYRSLNEIQDRRSADKKAFTGFVKNTKREEKAAAEVVEKQRKMAERAVLAAAKTKWDTDAKAYYKELRGQGKSTTEAATLRDEKFPKDQRPGTKDEAGVPVPPKTAPAAPVTRTVTPKISTKPAAGKAVPASGVPGATMSVGASGKRKFVFN